MDLRLIGIVRDNNNEMVGCRLIDLDNKEVRDVPVIGLVQTLEAGNVKIVGLKLEKNKSAGTAGGITQKPIMANGLVETIGMTNIGATGGVSAENNLAGTNGRLEISCYSE